MESLTFWATLFAGAVALALVVALVGGAVALTLVALASDLTAVLTAKLLELLAADLVTLKMA